MDLGLTTNQRVELKELGAGPDFCPDFIRLPRQSGIPSFAKGAQGQPPANAQGVLTLATSELLLSPTEERRHPTQWSIQ